MRSRLWIAALALLLLVQSSALVSAQEPRVSKTMLYTALFRIELKGDGDLPRKFESASDFQRQLSQLRGQVKSVETIRLQSLVGVVGSAQFGKRVPVVTGTASRGGGIVSRSYQSEDYGSIVTVQSRMDGDNVFAEIQYEATYPTLIEDSDESREEVGRRSITTIESRSTVVATFGEVTLLHHQQNGDDGVLVYVQFDGDKPATSSPGRTPRRQASGLGGRSRSAAADPRVNAQHEAYARSMATRYDTDRDGKLSYEDLARSNFLKNLRDRQFSNLKPGDTVTVGDLAKAMLESGAFGRSGTTGLAGGGSRSRSAGDAARRQPSRSSTTRRELSSSDSARAQSALDQSRSSRYQAYARSFFSRYDANKDSKIQRDEMPNRDLHTRWDADKDGDVTMEEFIEGMKQQRTRTTTESRQPVRPKQPADEEKAEESKKEEAEKADKLDKKISEVEARYLKYAELVVKKYDKDGDGALSQAELDQVAVLKRYKNVDNDGDGKSSAEELAKAMMKR